MVNEKEVAKRLQEIMNHHELSASAFAEKIGVQRSGISHILSGRNKPSLDFVMKVVRTFPEVDLYWLLNGKGDYPKTATEKLESTPRPEFTVSGKKEISRIIMVYEDGSFEVLDQKRV